MGRGRRFDDEPRLNMKKVLAVILAIAVLAMSIYVIIGLVGKSKKEGTIISKDYFASFKDNKWGVIDQTGSNVISPSYQEMIIVPNSKKDIFLCTYDVDYESGTYKTKAINSNNQAVFTDYEQIEAIQNIAENGNVTYKDNALKVKKDNKYGIIDLDGKNIIPCEYKEISSFDDTSYIVENEDGKYGVIDSLNKKILEPIYDEIEKPHSKDYYVVKKDNKQILVKKDGTEVLTEGYDEITGVLANDDNGVIYKLNNKYGVMGQDGTKKIEAKYDDLREAKSGMLIAKEGERYGIIDLEDKTQVDFKYISIVYSQKASLYIAEDDTFNDEVLDEDFKVVLEGIVINLDEDKGYIELRENGEYKYYNFRIEEKKEADIFKTTTLFVSKKDGKYGFVDKDGNVVVDYIYDDAVNQNALGYAAVKKDGKWGSIDDKGNVVQEPTYDLDDYLKIDFIGRWHLGQDVNMNYYNQQ